MDIIVLKLDPGKKSSEEVEKAVEDAVRKMEKVCGSTRVVGFPMKGSYVGEVEISILSLSDTQETDPGPKGNQGDKNDNVAELMEMMHLVRNEHITYNGAFKELEMEDLRQLMFEVTEITKSINREMGRRNSG